MKKQTAVEWLVKELNKNVNFVPMVHWDAIRDIVQRAKQFERQQIIDAVDGFPIENRNLDGEDYYNQTYNL